VLHCKNPRFDLACTGAHTIRGLRLSLNGLKP
jgi:hypothetical protein